MDELSKLKASAGERHERDDANNPQIGAGKVPTNSAASKTDSSLGHYVAGLSTDQDVEVPNPQSSTSNISGQSIDLNAEPALAESIAAKAQTASNPAAANHFAESASKLQEAYEQDKAWLAKHPEHAQTRQ